MKKPLKSFILVAKLSAFLIMFLFSNMYAQKQTLCKVVNPWKDDYTTLSDITKYRSWGTYNVHDPSCRKFGDYYYMYSTDAIWGDPHMLKLCAPIGNIQIRKSKDLVHWTFVGWAFSKIPNEAVKWVRDNANGEGATNVWAPFIMKVGTKYRLYYCVSAFGLNDSYIGLAESDSPEGPWIQKGGVVKTNQQSVMNAIDPTVIEDHENGKLWMIYGSYFGGIYCVQLDKSTGFTSVPNDKGHLVARRANYKMENMEAPEIIYQPELKKYFLFVSYGPLVTTYNIRVGKADHAEGPYTDFFGKSLTDTVNAYPILTAPYRFNHHKGWAGVAHCSVFTDENGNYYMAHQGRLSPQNMLMDLHVRRLFFTTQGWPSVSPERYAGEKLSNSIHREMLFGEWEIIRIHDSGARANLQAGQVSDSELLSSEVNHSFHINLTPSGNISLSMKGKWSYDNEQLTLELENEKISHLVVFNGHDWENETRTLLFTGIDENGCSVWGKRIK